MYNLDDQPRRHGLAVPELVRVVRLIVLVVEDAYLAAALAVTEDRLLDLLVSRVLAPVERIGDILG